MNFEAHGLSHAGCGRRRGALAIMVKTPGRSPVKTRMAVECGNLFAQCWYRRAAAAVAAVAQETQARHGIAACWAVAEADAAGAWPGLAVVAQGEGDLGARMSNVHAQLVAAHGYGVLLGADTPQLTPALLGEAVAWLGHAEPRLVMGPAADGGFWLLGANRVLPPALWTSVRYSAATTARDLHATMQDCGEWCTLAMLRDVDRADDLPAVLDALYDLPEPLPEQCALAAWMGLHQPACVAAWQ